MSEPVAYMARTRRYYEAQGFERPYRWARHETTPFAPLPKPLAECTLAVVTTAALYDREEADPRYVDSAPVSDPPARLFAGDLAWDKEATHLEDRASYLPLEALGQLAAAGRLGAVAPRFHCAPTEYSARRTREADAPELARRCLEDGADIVLLVPL